MHKAAAATVLHVSTLLHKPPVTATATNTTAPHALSNKDTSHRVYYQQAQRMLRGTSQYYNNSSYNGSDNHSREAVEATS
ncbi:hypothetical protein BJ741DRAFT_626818 [Chytriomyces cf. hyalinus JEL632]|nr:hypothetical protein BJ741DRAFT_626818 [Chytriomyces cf. hyalinus JEL632]